MNTDYFLIVSSETKNILLCNRIHETNYFLWANSL